MCHAPNPKPLGDSMISRAGKKAGKFAIGSLIPMNTSLSILLPACFRASMISPRISTVDKFRFSPSNTLAENLHPRAQPT